VLSYNDAAREVLPDLPVCFAGSSLKFIQTAQQAQWQACVADIVDKRARKWRLHVVPARAIVIEPALKSMNSRGIPWNSRGCLDIGSHGALPSVAIAKSQQIDAIYSDDEDVAKEAARVGLVGLKVIRTSELGRDPKVPSVDLPD